MGRILRGAEPRMFYVSPLRHLSNVRAGIGGRHWVSALLTGCFWQMDDPSVGPKIPQALEKILQLKESRQEEMNSQQGECCCA